MRQVASLILSLAILTTPAASADRVQTTSSNQATTAPEPAPLFQMHYKNRVRSFKEQNRLLQNVVLLGDSITEGFDTDKYLPGRRVLNRGIGADVIGNNLPANDKRGVLKRLDSSIFDCGPTAVFILIGINDLGQGHSPDVLEQGYRELFTRIREKRPELKLYVQSVLPCRDRFAKHNENVLEVNDRLQRLAAEYRAEYVDLHTQFKDADGLLKADYTNDGLHLTEDGYKLWKGIVEEKLGWN